MKFGVVEGIILGMVSTDTWFIKHKETGEMLIIDPADRADVIARQVAKMEGTPKAVLLTHGHFDHMMAAQDLREQYNIPIYALEEEKELLVKQNLMPIMGVKNENGCLLVIVHGMKHAFYVRTGFKDGNYQIAARFMLEKEIPPEDISFSVLNLGKEAE